jgi:isoleucyl-tRNA synthetase
VRLSRRRFWKGEPSEDKLAAYQTLCTCLETVARLMAPVAPFMGDWLFRNLNEVIERHQVESVHLAQFPSYEASLVDKELEDRMQLAQDISSTILALRKKVGQTGIKVRQPLAKVMIPVLNPSMKAQIQKVEQLIKSEVNVKEVEYISDAAGIVTKKIKPNFKVLGPKLGADMKAVATAALSITQQQIADLEKNGKLEMQLPHKIISLSLQDVEILTEDIPGWLVGSAGDVTVALDITITQALKDEGIAREIVSRLQKIRKDMNLEITDRIMVIMEAENELKMAIINYKAYICGEILADDFKFYERLPEFLEVLINDIPVKVFIQKT